MSNSRTIKNLQEIKNTIDQTIKNLDEGQNLNSALKLFNVGLDKHLAKIVKDLDGDAYHYKKSNETAWGLAMGEIY